MLANRTAVDELGRKINNLVKAVHESPTLGKALTKGYSVGPLVELGTDWNVFYAEATDGLVFDLTLESELNVFNKRYVAERRRAEKAGAIGGGGSSVMTTLAVIGIGAAVAMALSKEEETIVIHDDDDDDD